MNAIRIDDVRITDRARTLNLDAVNRLATSINDFGLLNPITVTPELRLVAGHHRLEACRLLNWESIPAVIVPLEGLRLELAEIDENLCRNDLTAIERCEHEKRKKEIYEALYPETKHGAIGNGRSRDPIVGSLPSFLDDTAAKTGRSRTAIAREVWIAENVVPEAKTLIAETATADNKADLERIARLEPDQQVAVAAQLATGTARDVRDAVAQIYDPAYGGKRPADSISGADDYDSDEWYTPLEIVEAAREVLGEIDLDPATCEFAQKRIQARRYFTREVNGLEQPWQGRVWLNPPYSPLLARSFADKLLTEWRAGRVTAAIVIQNASTDTAWFHALAADSTICLTRGRINFDRENGRSSQNRYGQVLFYLGSDGARFEQVFARFGLVGRLHGA